MSLINSALVDLTCTSTERSEATRSLAQRLADQGRVTDLEGFLDDIAVRESQLATGLNGGLAIPHARSEHVSEPTVGFARSGEGIAWGASDGPAHLIFLIAVPTGAATDHLAILAKLARRLSNGDFKESLLSVDDPEAAAKLIDDALTRS